MVTKEFDQKRCEAKGCSFRYKAYGLPGEAPTPTWHGILVEQKGRNFFLCAPPADEIEALSTVPSVPRGISSKKLGSLVAQGRAGKIEWWQRSLSATREKDIGIFFKEHGNLFVNAVILGLRKEAKEVDIEAMSRGTPPIVQISVKSWVKNKCPHCQKEFEEDGKKTWNDSCSHHGCHRSFHPFFMIDGQHRVSGVQSKTNQKYRDEPLPTVILPRDFSRSNQAKIYAEISVTAEPLTKYHSIWLRYQFYLGDMHQGRSGNRATYETGAWLVSDLLGSGRKSNPMLDRIQMWKGKHGYVSIHDFIREVRPFFDQKGCLWDPTTKTGKSPSKAAEDIREYVKAIRKTWPNAWSDKAPGGYLNNRGIFRRLLRLFPIICKRVARYQNDLRDEKHFHIELAHLTGLTWDQPDVWESFLTPDWKSDLLYRILEFKYDPSVQKPDLGSTRPGMDMNKWIEQAPDDFAITKPKDGARVRTGNVVQWQQPINGGRKFDIRIAHSGSKEPILRTTTKDHYKIVKDDVLKGMGEITVTVKNHTDRANSSSVKVRFT